MISRLLEIVRTVDGRLVIYVHDENDVELLRKLLDLGSGKENTTAPLVIEFDSKFLDYLQRDRGLDPRTARDYMNYLKKLSGQILDYNLYLKISGNRWMVKTVRLYVDYLRKTGKLDDSEAERLLKLFKLKAGNKRVRHYAVNATELTTKIHNLGEGSLYRLVLELLYYTGARLHEVVEMIRGYDESRLTCFDDKEFCRYFMGWYRGRKRCDYVYFPQRLLPLLRRYAGSIGDYRTVRKELFERYGVRSKLYRKLFYQTCREVGIDKEICDFYQSRVSRLSVGDVHYDNLLKRADEVYSKVVARLSATLMQR